MKLQAAADSLHCKARTGLAVDVIYPCTSWFLVAKLRLGTRVRKLRFPSADRAIHVEVNEAELRRLRSQAELGNEGEEQSSLPAEPDAQRDFEAVGVHQAFVGENFAGWTLGLQAAMVEDEHAIAQVEDQFQIVTGDDLGRFAGA